jgi:hypothetical protein
MFYISIKLNKNCNNLIVEETNFSIKQRTNNKKFNFYKNIKINDKDFIIYENSEIFLNIPFGFCISEKIFKGYLDIFILSNKLKKRDVNANFIELVENEIKVIYYYKSKSKNKNYIIYKTEKEIKSKFDFIKDVKEDKIKFYNKINKNQFEELMIFLQPTKNIYYYNYYWNVKKNKIDNSYKYNEQNLICIN